ncbi:MAG: LPS assembly protein LptD, partial [Candidatus Binatia bacterium]
FYGTQRLFDRRLKLGLNSEVVNFERRRAFDGPRVDLNPRATVPFRWQEFLNGSLEAQFRETAYHLNNRDLIIPLSQSGGVQTPSSSPTPLGENPTRELFQGTASIGTELARVFDVGAENVQKLKHTVEPGVEYLFIPDVEQDDLPVYDFLDRINRRNLLTYGFRSRLLAKLDRPQRLERHRPFDYGDLSSFSGVAPAPFDDERTRGGLDALGDPEISGDYPESDEEEAARTAVREPALSPEQRAARRLEEREALSNVVEWARLVVSQSYDLRDSLQEDRDDHFSDVDTQLRVSPTDYFSLRYESSVNVRESHLSAAKVGVLVRDPRTRSLEGFLRSTQRASVGVSYRFISESVLEEIDGGLVVPLADTLSVFYQSRYDALDKRFLENIGGFRLSSQCQCWVLDLSVANRVNPQETELRLQMTLIGLGSIGRSR